MDQTLSLSTKIIIDVSVVILVSVITAITCATILGSLLWMCQPGEPERRVTAPRRKRLIKIFVPITCAACLILTAIPTALIVFLLDPVTFGYLVGVEMV